MEKIVVGIVSDANALALSLVENLLSSSCRVKVFSDDKAAWEEKTLHIQRPGGLEILKKGDMPKEELSYFVYFNIYPKERAANAKNLFVFDYGSNKANVIENIKSNELYIFVGDLLGPRIDLSEDKPINKLLAKALAGEKIKVNQNQVFYPVFIPDVSKIIVKWLFSFGPYGDRVALVSRPVSALEIINLLKKRLGSLNVKLAEARQEFTPDFGMRKFILNTNKETALKETLAWYTANRQADIGKRKTNFSRTGKILALVLATLFMFSPFIISLFSSLLLFFAGKNLVSGNFSLARPALVISKSSAEIARMQSDIFSIIPLVGFAYEKSARFADILVQSSSVGEEGIILYKTASTLVSKILGDEVYDPEVYSQNLSLGFDSLYKRISFLESEVGNIPDFAQKIFANKELILHASRFARELPSLVGSGKSTTYLVLFQNNMELRPTGGFIGSYALLTFDGGRLVDVNVQDVYVADGQLKGHVEPPNAIKNYLDEANWYLRDSNWDPDFGVSAQRAEWFLDKEMDKAVDGVVALDLHPIEFLLESLGPIALPDFNSQIDKDNFYQKTQSEVESNFFPGSIKKTSFLTSLTRELLAKITKESGGNFFPITKAVYSSLNEKHIQIFFHNKEAQKVVSNLGWDGGVGTPSCLGNCYIDWFGLVEANVGVNKVNYYVKRKLDFSVDIDSKTITRKLSVLLENTAVAQNKNPNNYKVYLRLLIPQDAGEIKSEGLISEISDVAGRKEVGVFVNILPGEKREVKFEWQDSNNLDPAKRGEYGLYIRKQAGTASDPILIDIDQKASYNTTLARDFFSRISW